MTDSLTLTQQHLYTFQACPRRFSCASWRASPGRKRRLAPNRNKPTSAAIGSSRWIERRFLGLLVADESDHDPVLKAWWDVYRHHAPPLPEGRRFVETFLTVPIGQGGKHRLTGRFDLLVVGDNPPAASMFDWKTGDPRPIERLRRAWQTRVYLFLAAQRRRSIGSRQSGRV